MSKDAKPIKVVVRLLPPEITEDELLQTISEAHRQNMRWRSFVQGKRYKGEAKPHLNTRCYFAFEESEQAESFIKDYHGHQFVDGQGENFRAVACFAPYQKVPKSRPSKDARDGTIQDDATFKEFLEGLSKGPVSYEAPPNPVSLLKPADYGDTPLLNFMKQKAKERRARLEKQRKQRWGGLEAVEEEPRRPRWVCAECGISKNLEEDPDDRGTFYCTYCWEFWENQTPAPSTKVKKKKKKKGEAEEVAEEEEEAPAEESKKSRKKKKKEKEAAAAQDSAGGHAEGGWSSQGWGASYYEEEETAKKKKKKKKDKQEEAAEEPESSASKGKWRAKGDEAYGYDEDWGASSSRSKARSHREKDDGSWWSSEPADDRSSRRSGRSSEKYEESKGSRWQGTDEAASEEKSKRTKSRKEGKDDGSSYWVPKGK